jgi:hypothetical protein
MLNTIAVITNQGLKRIGIAYACQFTNLNPAQKRGCP